MRRFVMGSLFVVLAACGHAPSPLGVPSPKPGTTRPAVDPTATPRVIPAGAPRIVMDATKRLHPASPYVNGYNRNHTQSQFAVHGMDRTAMLAALRRLSPTWGQAYLDGLASAGYPVKSSARALYRTGHGPTDGRLDYSYMPGYMFQAFWDLDGAPKTWDGYAYDDMRNPLGEAEEAGAEPLITVNFGSDTAPSAGLLTRWLNAASEPLRSRRPFHVTSIASQATAPRGAFMFEIGNEVALGVEVGHERANSIEEYVDNAAPYVTAVRAGSPHPVKVALSAATNIFWGGPNNPEKGDAWRQRAEMVRAFIAEALKAGITFDALQYHGYPAYPVVERLAGNAYAETLIRDTIAPALLGAPWGPIEIWNDEFHAASPSPRNTGMYGALYAADATVTALTLTQNGHQLMPVTTDFAAWHAGAGNGNDSLYFQNDTATSTTPLYEFRRLLATHFGDWVVETRTTGVGEWVDVARNGEETHVSNLHAVASVAPDGTLYLLVVNRGHVDETVWLDPPARTATLSTLATTAAEPWEASWQAITVKEDQALDLKAPVTFARGTIAFVTLKPY